MKAKILTIGIAAGLFVLISFAAVAGDLVLGGDNITETGLPISGGTMSGDIDMDGNDITMGYGDISECDDIYFGGATAGTCPVARTADAAPYPLTVKAGDCYARGTQTPAALYLGGGVDEKFITFAAATPANTVGDTITATCNGTALAGLVEPGGWACVGQTTDQCAVNVAAALDAQAGACATYTAAAGVVYAQPDECATLKLSHAYTDAGGAAGVVVSNGTEAQVLLGSKGTAALPAVSFIDDPNTGFSSTGADQLTLSTGGTSRLAISTTAVTLGLDLNTGTSEVTATNALELGDNVATSHGLTATDVITKRDLEVDGVLYCDLSLMIPNGTALPATCTVGFVFHDTDSNDCANTGGGDGALCICKTLNTWALIANF